MSVDPMWVFIGLSILISHKILHMIFSTPRPSMVDRKKIAELESDLGLSLDPAQNLPKHLQSLLPNLMAYLEGGPRTARWLGWARSGLEAVEEQGLIEIMPPETIPGEVVVRLPGDTRPPRDFQATPVYQTTTAMYDMGSAAASAAFQMQAFQRTLSGGLSSRAIYDQPDSKDCGRPYPYGCGVCEECRLRSADAARIQDRILRGGGTRSTGNAAAPGPLAPMEMPAEAYQRVAPLDLDQLPW